MPRTKRNKQQKGVESLLREAARTPAPESQRYTSPAPALEEAPHWTRRSERLKPELPAITPADYF